MNSIKEQLAKRRTFAIISHPDAGKTTLTEKLLLLGGAINLAGTVKARKASKHATSDWMELEKKRGISVTTSVMQFEYVKHIFNLLDTPGHADFSEDTYRTLTAVDSAMMVIDVAKGVEARTIKLMEVCRMRDTPIITFINKCDRFGKDPISLLDEIEYILKIHCAPITWPIGLGTDFKGVYHLLEKSLYLYGAKQTQEVNKAIYIKNLDSKQVLDILDEVDLENLKAEIELIEAASHSFDHAAYLQGTLTPVFFGSALINFGVDMILQSIAEWAPAPLSSLTSSRKVKPDEKKFSAFAFKVQANMDPKHRDRIAFLRVTSGKYEKGKKLFQVRTKKQLNTQDALTFMAGNRVRAIEAYAGDIIGLHNHGTIQIGDSFSEGEIIQFTGIPHFAPELFKSVRPRDPLKMKSLLKGLIQLSEEGATQIFRPLISNQIILGAVGVLQFDVVQHRLHFEYNADCIYENITVATARWVTSTDTKKLEEFKNKARVHLAVDGKGELTYIAPTMVNLQLTQERWPDINFAKTCEVVG